MRAALLVLMLVSLASCGDRPDYVPRYFQPVGEGELTLIPFDPPEGYVQLVTRVCRPDSGARVPVVVIAHGAPSRPDLISQMTPGRCDSEAVRWFTERGYMVVLSLRRGFGGSTGPAVENGSDCERVNYFRVGLRTAEDIDATVNWATSRPDALPDGAVVVGQSTGGWGVIAYNSVHHPHVAGLINMAGGRGAYAYGEPGSVCSPEAMIGAARRFGETSFSPMLWVYARNDSFFQPSLVADLHETYTHVGGKAELFQPVAPGAEGHGLFNAPGGSAIWGPAVARYLSSFPPPTSGGAP